MPRSLTPHPETRERIARWVADPDVVGIVHVGSRTRPHGDERSDDDLEVLLAPAAFARIAPADCHALLVTGEGSSRRIIYDAQLTTLAEYDVKQRSTHDLDHWPYESAVVHHDPSGEVARAIAALGVMPAGFRRDRIRHATIDAWAAAHRARKTFARGQDAAARLVLDRAVRALTRVVFALESRWSPLDHWWQAELATLADPHGAGPRMVRALLESDPAPLFEGLEALAPALVEWGVPAEPAGRGALFLELIHISNAAERAVHATS